MTRLSWSWTRSRNIGKKEEEVEVAAHQSAVRSCGRVSWKLEVVGQAKRTQDTVMKNLAIPVKAKKEVSSRLRWTDVKKP